MQDKHPNLEVIVKIAARLRQLTADEFCALRWLVERGIEREEHLDAVSLALLDVLAISEAEAQGFRVKVT